MIRYILLLFIALFALSCNKEEINPAIYECNDDISFGQYPRQAELDDFIDKVYRMHLPGISILVANENGEGWVAVRGKMDIANNVDFQPCTMSRIGSITKTYTATVIMYLHENKKLNINDKIAGYLSDATIHKIDNGNEITIKQLLNHTSGIVNYTNTTSFGTDFLNNPARDWTMDKLIDYIDGESAEFAPGTSHRYSNTNYILLHMIAEKVANKSLGDLFYEYILSPLHLNHTYFNPDNPAPGHIARCYMDLYKDDKIVETTHYRIGGFGDGGISTNIFDLYRFTKGLFSAQLLSPNTLNLMQEWVETPEPEYRLTKYGLGLRYWETEYGYAVGHTGGGWGFLAETFYFPEHKTYVCFMVNGSHGNINKIVDEELHTKLPEVIFGN